MGKHKIFHAYRGQDLHGLKKGGDGSEGHHQLSESAIELKTCVLAINLFFAFLVLVLVLLQTTHVLWVYNVYNSWVV